MKGKTYISYSVVAIALLFALNLSFLEAEERKEEGVGLTIYNGNWAVVKEWRNIDLKKGLNKIAFQDVAKFIDPTSVSFKSLTDPVGTSVLEQNYEYDLVNRSKLLEKYIDKEITLEREYYDEQKRYVQRKDVKLLSTEGGMVVKDGDEISLNPFGNIILPALPEGLITKPTLVWMINTKKTGRHLSKVTYQTNGIDWNADYILVTNKDDTNMDFSAWVTIKNQSGATYKDAQIKLMAGDVQRVSEPQFGLRRDASYPISGIAKMKEQFSEKAFFEYHLYTLQRPTTLKDNSNKQIELFNPVSGVPLKKIFVYYGNVDALIWSYGGSAIQDRNYGTTSNKKVDIYLEFLNKEENRLGIPLPEGRIRVYKKDEADGSLEFVGEDKIDHTPKDEKVLIKLGSAFDIVGERKQIDFKVNYDRDWMHETFEIKIRNHKKEPVTILVKEVLYRWINWKIENASHKYEKENARTIYFPVTVNQDGEEVITYTVLYTW
ncbi:MAG: DUF4139 domain-containing protein [Candidatus Omnitrophota bacterium]